MITSKIAPLGGVPTLFVNDKPVPEMAYITYFTDKNRYADFAKFGVKLYSVTIFFSEQPLNENGQTPKFVDGIFEGGERLELIDLEVQRILDACPDALIFPRVNTSLPRDWELAHPDELCDHAIHTVDGVERHRASFSSDAWMAETERLLIKFVKYCQSRPWADHIIGYQIAGGNTDEWFSLDLRGSIGKRSREKFAARVAAGEFSDTEADYYRYLSRITAERVDRLAALTKELTDHRLVVGAFYGYTYECPGRASCHHAMNFLLDSPNVDFFCSPMSYMDVRPVDDDQANSTAIDSIKRRGKLYFVENDTRTDISKAPWQLPNYIKPIWFGPDRAGSVEMIKKHFARALCHGHAMWWFDMWGGWYDAPEFKALFPTLRKIAEESLAFPRASAAKAAVFVDERAFAEVAGTPGFVSRIRHPLGKVGAAYDAYLADDFDAVADRYALCIFLVPAETALMRGCIERCKSAKLVITPDTPMPTAAELREKFREAGVPLRMDGDAIVYESESYLYVRGEGEPLYEGELEQLYGGTGRLYRKK